MNAYFFKKTPNPDITEWYSTQEMQDKFGMTLSTSMLILRTRWNESSTTIC